MKKLVDGIIRTLLILLMLTPYFITPMEAKANFSMNNNPTIREMRRELDRLRAERTRQQNERNLTQNQINNARNSSNQARVERDRTINRIAQTEEEIKESEEQIEKSREQIDELMVFLQVTESHNVFLEYIASATSVTDFIVKAAVVDQMTRNNERIIENQRELIQRNENLKEELRQRNVQLNNQIVELQESMNVLGSRLKELVDLADDIDTEIRNLENNINFWRRECNNNEDIRINTCVRIDGSAGWTRPLVQGRITSPFGPRVSPITGQVNSFHDGIDIGGNPQGTPIFASAAGIVAVVNHRMACGGNRVILHVNVNGQTFTVLYAHLLSVNVSVGDTVNINTVIGTVGGGNLTPWDRCSTGPHLHYSIVRGRHTSVNSAFVANAINPPGFPGVGVTWRTRV